MELDFLYVPSADVAADATYWVNVLERVSFSQLMGWARVWRCSNWVRAGRASY
jgi:hypothetical protein